MNDIPRSRAIVAFDRNGYLLPIEPVTPPGSKTWQVVHLSPVLVAFGVGLFFLATFASGLVAFALRHLGLGGRAFYAVPVLGTAIVVASYWLFVRVVERRREMPELSWSGWWWEIGASAGGGVLIFAVIVLAMGLMGDASVVGIGPPRGAALALLLAACGAVVQEVVMRGEIFRLVERLAGSLISLTVSAAILGVIQLLRPEATLLTVASSALENGVLFGAAFMVTRRLWAPVGLHVATSVLPLLVTLELTGSAAMTGGDRGPFVSWPAIAVTAVACAALLIVAARRSRIVAPSWTRQIARPNRRSARADLGQG